jgi:hypothetical protein
MKVLDVVSDMGEVCYAKKAYEAITFCILSSSPLRYEYLDQAVI